VSTRHSSRLAQLLVVSDIDARAVLAIELEGYATLASLQAELDLSSGGAVAVQQRLERERIVVREADPYDPRSPRLRLSKGAALEVSVALAGRRERPA
jgi:DNA-binding MarR family transcriptional regulator